MTPTKALSQESIGALLEQIRSLDPVDAREEESRGLILALLPTMEDPFNEQRGPLHVTASALLAHRQGTVLHKHRRLGIWLQPGGHIEDGETPPSAALRE
ncbi:MAG: NUDIX domain-containing protein, partial [Actinobacteria bacterium]|nr:NUDIX domain-containing protein [Actinomycetota bacterium]